MEIFELQKSTTPEQASNGRRQKEIRKTKIADRSYILYEQPCGKCDKPHYVIYRFCGASFCCYRMDGSFDESHFDDFVERIDEALLQSAPELIQDYHERLTNKNNERGIDADGSFAFRLLEYGRHRISFLNKLGVLDALISSKAPVTSQHKAVRAAFELGMAAAEHRLMDCYEDYLWDGMAVSEWREAGLPRAREERLRQGKRTHVCVVGAAKKLYERDNQLRRNDSETARQIIAMGLPELQKDGGGGVGFDAITRHLRAARDRKEI